MKKNYNMKISGGCLVCGRPATRILNLRMRRADTGASFGPNIIPAVFCERHGDHGADVEIVFQPNETGMLRFTITVGDQEVAYNYPLRNEQTSPLFT